jgi:hypothetical protein
MANSAVVCNVNDLRHKIEETRKNNHRDSGDAMLGLKITPEMRAKIVRSHSEYEFYNFILRLRANQAKIERRPPKKTHDEIIKKSNEEIYIAHMREQLIKHKDSKRKRVDDVIVVIEKKKKI